MSGVSRLNLWIRIQEKSGELGNLQMVCVCVCVFFFFSSSFSFSLFFPFLNPPFPFQPKVKRDA